MQPSSFYYLFIYLFIRRHVCREDIHSLLARKSLQALCQNHPKSDRCKNVNRYRVLGILSPWHSHAPSGAVCRAHARPSGSESDVGKNVRPSLGAAARAVRVPPSQVFGRNALIGSICLLIYIRPHILYARPWDFRYQRNT
jgi:hypothetical protein